MNKEEIIGKKRRKNLNERMNENPRIRVKREKSI